MIEDKGEIELSGADDMNIPVNSFLHSPDETKNGKWEWTAENFCPRKSSVYEGMYKIHADTKEEIVEMVTRYVAPLYATAFTNLVNAGSNYYWEATK